jgi:hypothetical protein
MDNPTDNEKMLDELEISLTRVGKSIQEIIKERPNTELSTIFAIGAWYFRMVNDLIPNNERNRFINEVFEFAMRSREQKDENISS